MTWEPTGLGREWMKDRYCHEGEDSWVEVAGRVGHVVGQNQRDQHRYMHAINQGGFVPGGRILTNAGRPKASMLNCYVVPTGDSREAWGQSLSDVLVVSGMGGGVGTNFGSVRPRGAHIRGTGGQATGAVSHMRMHDAVGNEVRAGGGRRTALMQALPINHPDIIEFITTKARRKDTKDDHKNANVSVVIPSDYDPVEFVDDVRQGLQMPLFFDHQVYGKVNARKLWDLIIRCAFTSGDPGILNQHLANQESNAPYELECTNPCGEIWLPPYGCCCLGSLVLPSFVRTDLARPYWDWDRVEQRVRLGVRFLDNVLDANSYPLDSIRDMAQGERRIGLGVMGLHTALLQMGLRYSSNEGRGAAAHMFQNMANWAYQESAQMARESGTFKGFDIDRVMANPFVQRLDDDTQEMIRRWGLHNVALLCVAPTGTTSGVRGVTNGIEPLYSPVYLRKNNVHTSHAGQDVQTTLVISKEFQQYPELAEGALNMDVEDHILMQEAIQEWVDNSVSKTINTHVGADRARVGAAILRHLPRLKGVTLYAEGSKEDQPLTSVLDIEQTLATWDGPVDHEGSDALDCAGGSCSIV
jgi:ribonucleoside-diphosphate reductase alpha chain